MSGRASAIYLASRVLSGALSVVAVSLFARGLGPEGYAWLTLAMAGSALVAGVFMQPVHHSYARFFPRDGFENLLPTLARVLLLFVLVLLLIALSVEAFAHAWIPVGVALGAWVLGSAQGIFDFSAQHANSDLKPERYSVLYAVKALLVVGIGYVALRTDSGRVGVVCAIVSGFIFSSFIVSFSSWRNAWRGTWTPALLATIKPYALPLAASFFLGAVLMWADRLVLALLVSKTETGAFGAAADLTQQGLGLMSSAFFLAWYPRLIKAAEQQDATELQRLANRYATLAALVLLPAALGFVLVRENFVHLFLGTVYAEIATVVIPWLALAAVLAGLRAYMLDIPLHIAGKMKVLLRNVGICAACSVLLNFCLIPVLGALGAGVAAVAVQALGCMLAWFYGRGVIKWGVSRRDIVAVLAGCAAMTLAVVAFQHIGTIWFLLQVSMGCIAYLSVMIMCDAADCRKTLVVTLSAWYEARRRT